MSDNTICSNNCCYCYGLWLRHQFALVVICSVLICVLVLITACGLLEKPVGRLNQSFQETWTRPAKTACRGIETGRCRWNRKLALAPNRVLNLIIHSLFILLPSSQYQSLARGRCSRCFVTRGVTLNSCQWSWSHRLNQQIQGWLMFTERLDLSRSVLLKRWFIGALQIFFRRLFQKWSQVDNLGLSSDSLSTQDTLPHQDKIQCASRWPNRYQTGYQATEVAGITASSVVLEKCGYVRHNLAVVHIIGLDNNQQETHAYLAFSCRCCIEISCKKDAIQYTGNSFPILLPYMNMVPMLFLRPVWCKHFHQLRKFSYPCTIKELRLHNCASIFYLLGLDNKTNYQIMTHRPNELILKLSLNLQ